MLADFNWKRPKSRRYCYPGLVDGTRLSLGFLVSLCSYDTIVRLAQSSGRMRNEHWNMGSDLYVLSVFTPSLYTEDLAY